MWDEHDDRDDAAPACCRGDCTAAADFWLHPPDGERWRPLCRRHVVHLHPSIELRVWLETGYARPVERGHPDGPPADPATDRAAAFRAVVDEAIERSK